MPGENQSPLSARGIPAAWLLLVVFLAAAAWVWGHDLSDREFLGDDYIYLYNAERVPHWFAGNFCHWGPKNHLRPVTWFVVYLEYKLFGLNAPAHHALHLLLHLGNGLLFFLVATRLFPRQRTTAAAAAGLFWLYPLHAEPLAWASGAVDIIAAFFLLAALVAHLRGREHAGRFWKLITFVFLGLALYAKETGFSLMLLIPLTDLFASGPRAGGQVRSQAKSWLAVWSIGALYLLSRGLLLGGLAGPDSSLLSGLTQGRSLPTALLSALPQAFRTLCLPLPQAESGRLGSGAAYLAIGLIAWFSLGLLRARILAVTVIGALWLIITLLPALPAFGIGPDLEQSRYLYLPSLGFCLALAAPLALRETIAARWRRLLLYLPLVLLLGAESIAGRANLRPWQESSRLVRQLFQQLTRFRPLWQEGDTVILYDLPRMRKGAQVLGDDQSLTAALSFALFPSSVRLATTHRAHGLRFPLTAETRGFISPAAEIPPPRWDLSRLGRDWFVYQHQPDGWRDLTGEMRRRLAARHTWRESAPGLSPLELYRPGAEHRLTLHHLLSPAPGEFQVTGPHPWVLFPPLQLTAGAVDRLEVELQPAAFGPGPVWLTLYWSSAARPDFSEVQRASFQMAPDLRWQKYRLDLGNRPRWLEAEIVRWLRLDFSPNFPRMRVRQVRLLPAANALPTP